MGANHFLRLFLSAYLLAHAFTNAAEGLLANKAHPRLLFSRFPSAAS